MGRRECPTKKANESALVGALMPDLSAAVSPVENMVAEAAPGAWAGHGIR